MKNSNPLKLVRRLTGEIPLGYERIRAGRNSRVFRVDCRSGRAVLVKFYLQATADGRSRLGQEWSALSLMHEAGFKNIPLPQACDESLQAGIYSFIHGRPVKNSNADDILEILAFMADLKRISGSGNAINFFPAAEACFSPAELEKNLLGRLAKLQLLPEQDEQYKQMHSFLNNQFAVKMGKSIAAAEKIFPGKLWEQELPKHLRTFSPSDFGFHNALHTESGLCFVDFEYFGEDDPVKATSDFLLHPAMELNAAQMRLFYEGMKKTFADDKNFSLRFQALHPLFCLKWCTILLNEFINHHLERREFASGVTAAQELRAKQLAKAEIFINKDKQILSALNIPTA